MIRFVPSSAAEALSGALWRLARPEGVWKDGETSHLFPWRIDTQGNRWLVVDTEFDIPVHPEAELNGVGDILQPYVVAGQLPSSIVTDLEALVVSKRGQRLVPWEFFPALFQNASKTHAEMIDAGLLAVPTMS